MIFKFPGMPSIMLMALDTKVQMDITGNINRVTVEQSFTNPSNEWAEGVYVFPLPEDSAVDQLRMYIDDRVIEGQDHGSGVFFLSLEVAEAEQEDEEDSSFHF